MLITLKELVLADGAPQGPNRARLKESLGGDIPEKYYIVRNNDLMRVKYLLVFAEKKRKE